MDPWCWFFPKAQKTRRILAQPNLHSRRALFLMVETSQVVFWQFWQFWYDSMMILGHFFMAETKKSVRPVVSSFYCPFSLALSYSVACVITHTRPSTKEGWRNCRMGVFFSVRVLGNAGLSWVHPPTGPKTHFSGDKAQVAFWQVLAWFFLLQRLRTG